MAHHWRASDGLVRVSAGEWRLWDRGRLVGTIQYGSAGGRPAFRGVIRRGELEQVIGYSASLEQACTDFWNWDVRFGGSYYAADPPAP
jgi:hypothetical protein